MAIERKHSGHGGKYITVPGEYVVKVVDIKVGRSKTDKPMLTVTFETDQELRISGYYVKGLTFHMDALADLKMSLGLKRDSAAEDMHGHRCGIAVDKQDPTEDGKVFMRIVGYGKETDVDANTNPNSTSPLVEQTPF